MGWTGKYDRRIRCNFLGIGLSVVVPNGSGGVMSEQEEAPAKATVGPKAATPAERERRTEPTPLAERELDQVAGGVFPFGPSRPPKGPRIIRD